MYVYVCICMYMRVEVSVTCSVALFVCALRALNVHLLFCGQEDAECMITEGPTHSSP